MKKKRTDYTDEEWSNLSNKDKLNCFISDKPSSLMEDIKWRQDNEGWLWISACAAIKVLSYIRDKNITKKEFGSRIHKSEDYINLLVKGKQNLDIKTIAEIEKLIGEKIMYAYYDVKELLDKK